MAKKPFSIGKTIYVNFSDSQAAEPMIIEETSRNEDGSTVYHGHDGFGYMCSAHESRAFATPAEAVHASHQKAEHSRAYIFDASDNQGSRATGVVKAASEKEAEKLVQEKANFECRKIRLTDVDSAEPVTIIHKSFTIY